jgi:hypothetical protein
VVNETLLPISNDTIALTVSGAGAANGGIVYVWVERY